MTASAGRGLRAGEALVAFGLVPFVYAATFVAVAAARRTGASLALTGRRRLLRAAPAGDPA